MLDRLIPLIVVFAAAPIHGAELPTELKVLSYDEQVEALKSESSKTLVHFSAKKMPEPTPAEIREYEKKAIPVEVKITRSSESGLMPLAPNWTLTPKHDRGIINRSLDRR
jgi:hypothetical protein